MYYFQYYFLHIAFILTLVQCCRNISKSRKYWKWTILPILGYVVVEGMRWGREIDWCVYYSVYNDISKGYNTGHELLFYALWKIFAVVGLPYYVVVSFSSFLFIYSLFYYFKPHKKILFWIIPFIIFASIHTTENLIRWYTGMAFLLIAVRLYQENRKIMALFFSVSSIFIHIGLTPLLPILILMFSITKTIKPIYSIIIAIILIITFNPVVLERFSFIFDYFKFYSRFETYSSDAAGWLSGSGQNSSSVGKDIGMKLLTFIPLTSYIIVGYRICANRKDFVSLYNLMLLAIYLRLMASGLELIGRYTLFFDLFMYLIAAYSISFLIKKRHRSKSDNLLLFLACLFFLAKVKNYYTLMYDEVEFIKYVWNKHLDPTTLFYMYKSIQ